MRLSEAQLHQYPNEWWSIRDKPNAKVKERAKKVITPNEELICRIVDPINAYLQDICNYLRKPDENYILGVAALVRNCATIIIASGLEDNGLEKYGKRAVDIRLKINTYMHFQGFHRFDPSTEEFARDELSSYDGERIGQRICILISELTNLLLEDEVVEYFEGRITVANELHKIIEEAKYNEKHPFNRLLKFSYINEETTIIHRLIDALATTLDLADNLLNKSSSLDRIKQISICTASRILAEKCGYSLTWNYRNNVVYSGNNPCYKIVNPDTKQEDKGPKLDEYKTWIKEVIEPIAKKTSWDDTRKVQELSGMMEVIQKDANSVLDEIDEKASLTIEDIFRGVRGNRFNGDRKRIRRIIAATACICDYLYNVPRPKSVKSLIEKYQKDIVKLQRENKFHRYFSVPLAASFIVAIFVLGISVYQYFTPDYSYYEDYTWKFGEPVGINSLMYNEAQGRVHFEFVTEKRILLIRPQGMITHVRRIDASGELTDEAIDFMKYRPAELIISSDNRNEAVFLDAKGNKLTRASYTEIGAGVIKVSFYNPEVFSEMPLPADLTMFDLYNWSKENQENIYEPNRSAMTSAYLFWDENGFVKKVSFRDDDLIYADANGVSEITLDRDYLGRVTGIKYDYDSVILATRNGINIVKGTPERVDLLSDERITEKSILYAQDGIYKIIQRRANLIIDMEEYGYDDLGNCSSIKYYNDNHFIMAKLFKFDEVNNNLLIEAFVDKNGMYCEGLDNWAYSVYEYNEGILARQSRYDKDGLLIKPEKGWAVFIRQIAKRENGYSVIESYYDDNGNLLLTSAGYAYSETQYLGNSETTRYFDQQMNMIPRKEGFYQYQRTITPDRSIITLRYLDQIGNLVNINYGYAEVKMRYIGSLLAEKTFFDRYGNRVNNNQGYCSISYSYNGSKKITGIKYETSSGFYPDRFNQEKREYYSESNGRLKSIAYYFDSKLVEANSAGCAYISFSYDDINRSRSWQYYNSNGKPKNNEEHGYSKIIQYFNETGGVYKEEYYNTDGLPEYVNDISGYSRQFIDDVVITQISVEEDSESTPFYIKRTYDAAGNINLIEYQNKDFQTINAADQNYCKEEYKRLEEDGYSVVYVNWIDVFDKYVINEELGVFSKKIFYDENDCLIKQIYIDESKNPMESLEGYSECRWIYEDGMILSQSYFDKGGEPAVLHNLGYSEIRYTYGDNGKVLSEQYFDDGKRVNHAINGYSYVNYCYDSFENLRSEAYYNSFGNRVNCEKDYALANYYYDAKGNIIRTDYFDEYLNPARLREALLLDTTFRTSVDYSKELMYDAGVGISSGTMQQLHTYDGKDLSNYTISIFPERLFTMEEIEDEYYSVLTNNYDIPVFQVEDMIIQQYAKEYVQDGNFANLEVIIPMDLYSDDEEFKLLYCIFNEAGERVEDTWINTEGYAGINGNYGYATCARTYDSDGNLTELLYCDEFGDIMMCGNYAGVLLSYNEYSQLMSVIYIDDNFTPIINPKSGFAIMRIEYDDMNRIQRVSYMGSESPLEFVALDDDHYAYSLGETKLSNNTKLGYSVINYLYHADGSIKQVDYFDENKVNMSSTERFYTFTRRNLSHDEIKKRDFSEDVQEVDSYAYLSRAQDADHFTYAYGGYKAYDLNGYLKEIRYYDSDLEEGELSYVADATGAYKYDIQWANEHVESIIINDSRTMLPNTYCLIDELQDSANNALERTIFCRYEDGSELICFTYDAEGNVVRISCRDIEGNLKYCDWMGCAVVCQIFSENGIIGQYFLDENENYMTNRIFDCVAIQYKVDDNENISIHLDHSGKEIGRKRAILNDKDIWFSRQSFRLTGFLPEIDMYGTNKGQ